MSAARPFIKSRLADLRKEIDGELLAWISGKKHPHLEFSGSLPLAFWNNTLNDFVARITDAAFVAAHEIAEKNGIDSIAAAKAASDVSENEVIALIDKMIDYDRKMRGKGFPKSVPARDASRELKAAIDFISKRKKSEIELLKESIKERKKLRITVALLGLILAFALAPFTIFGPIGCSIGNTDNTKPLNSGIQKPLQTKIQAFEVPSVHFVLPPPQEEKPKSTE